VAAAQWRGPNGVPLNQAQQRITQLFGFVAGGRRLAGSSRIVAAAGTLAAEHRAAGKQQTRSLIPAAH